jgi:hypothetical protein
LGILLLRLDQIMPNRARGSELWSEILQVSVSPETKEQVAELAATEGKSQSSKARELLETALGKEPSPDD